jgi:8-oxo-dGTP pyrophosphatase MutT (NUDIX family)
MNSAEIQPPRQFRVSIKALIIDYQRRLLLLHSKNEDWMLPGGGLEHGEQIEEALRREIQEELGVEADAVATYPSYTWTKEISPNFWMLILTYKTTIVSTNFTLEEGIEQARFFSPEELKTLTFEPGKQLALDQAHLAKIVETIKK